jgi:hypothetical protein
VKSASRLVGGIAASTLNLQDGIANMAGESVVLDAHLAVPSSSCSSTQSDFSSDSHPPLLLSLFLCMPTIHTCPLISLVKLATL